jgi:hypothetical protein
MRWEFGRAVVSTPGKHGDRDYRAEIRGVAPTLGEFALLLGGKLMAEDRYNRPGQYGRHLYLGYLREVAQAAAMDDVVEIAERAQAATDASGGLPGFVRCCKGGQNECVSLCPDCYRAGFRLPVEVVRSTLLWWGLADDDDIDDFVVKVRGR